MSDRPQPPANLLQDDRANRVAEIERQLRLIGSLHIPPYQPHYNPYAHLHLLPENSSSGIFGLPGMGPPIFTGIPPPGMPPPGLPPLAAAAGRYPNIPSTSGANPPPRPPTIMIPDQPDEQRLPNEAVVLSNHHEAASNIPSTSGWTPATLQNAFSIASTAIESSSLAPPGLPPPGLSPLLAALAGQQNFSVPSTAAQDSPAPSAASLSPQEAREEQEASTGVSNTTTGSSTPSAAPKAFLSQHHSEASAPPASSSIEAPASTGTNASDVPTSSNQVEAATSTEPPQSPLPANKKRRLASTVSSRLSKKQLLEAFEMQKKRADDAERKLEEERKKRTEGSSTVDGPAPPTLPQPAPLTPPQPSPPTPPQPAPPTPPQPAPPTLPQPAPSAPPLPWSHNFNLSDHEDATFVAHRAAVRKFCLNKSRRAPVPPPPPGSQGWEALRQAADADRNVSPVYEDRLMVESDHNLYTCGKEEVPQMVEPIPSLEEAFKQYQERFSWDPVTKEELDEEWRAFSATKCPMYWKFQSSLAALLDEQANQLAKGYIQFKKREAPKSSRKRRVAEDDTDYKNKKKKIREVDSDEESMAGPSERRGQVKSIPHSPELGVIDEMDS